MPSAVVFLIDYAAAAYVYQLFYVRELRHRRTGRFFFGWKRAGKIVTRSKRSDFCGCFPSHTNFFKHYVQFNRNAKVMNGKIFCFFNFRPS